MEKNSTQSKPLRIHNLMLENRKKLQLSGVLEVRSFSEQSVVLILSEGALVVTGKELKITAFSVDDGVATLEGTVDNLRYTAVAQKGSFLKKIIK